MDILTAIVINVYFVPNSTCHLVGPKHTGDISGHQ